MSTIKVVLIDDHQLYLDGLVAVFSNHKTIQITATYTNAKEALKELDFTEIDLLITDISMPDVNGIELVNAIRKEDEYLKILVASSFEQMISKKNINGYIQKNADKKDFETAIKQVVLEEKNYFPKLNLPSEKFFDKKLLTKREKEITLLITQEKTVDEIADLLFLSRLTVETHKKNIFLKLGVKTNAGLVKKAMILGII
jgi:DNA-binding NarL/FixJ family response regulator